MTRIASRWRILDRMTGSAAYNAWLRAGQPDSGLALPLVQLRDVLRGAGYTVYDRPNAAHLQAPTPEDHTPFSATGWPDASPRWWRHAIDVMPKSGAAGARDLWLLGARIAGDRNAGLITWLKYINRPPAADLGRAIQDSWQPGHAQRSSSDTGHLHLSSVTGVETLSAPYNPLATAVPSPAPKPIPEDHPMFVAVGQDKTVYLCDGMISRPLDLDAYNNLKTLVSEGLIKLTNDVNAPRAGWFEGAFGALEAAGAIVSVDETKLASSVKAALTSVRGAISFS